MKTKYQIAAVVGRFEPYHNVHHRILNHALGLAERIIVILGSAKTAPDTRNPFTPIQREKMIRACFDAETNARITFAPIRDYYYAEHIWEAEVQNIVRNEQEDYFELPEGQEPLHAIKLADTKVCLVGYDKDATSYYLKRFPQWKFEEYYANPKESQTLNATDIRELYLADAVKNADYIKDMVPNPVLDFLLEFRHTQEYVDVVADYNYYKQYGLDAAHKNLPYAPTFNTTDAVVICKGHILLVRRGTNPGRNRVALPGGFLAEGKTFRENCIKELKEETRINIHASILDNLIKDKHEFDHPRRSLRGRVISMAYFIDINIKVDDGLPLVRGGDDAAKAFWIPIASLGDYEDQFFEDHYDIIRHFLGWM